MAVYRSSSRGNTTGAVVIDDGTNYNVKVGSFTLFKIRKSDGQLLISAGLDTDSF